MFYLYAPNTKTETAMAVNWVALRDHIHKNGLTTHFITQGPLKADHSNIIKAYRPKHLRAA